MLWGVSWFPTWPSCDQKVVTSALWECGSGAPQRRVLRGPCLLSKPPGKNKTKQKRSYLIFLGEGGRAQLGSGVIWVWGQRAYVFCGSIIISETGFASSHHFWSHPATSDHPLST